MIRFFKQLLFDNYAYCPWNKYIPTFICKRFNLLKVGVWLLNLNNSFLIIDEGGNYKLKFIDDSYTNFYLNKKSYTVTDRKKIE